MTEIKAIAEKSIFSVPFFPKQNMFLSFIVLGGYRPLLAIACQPPGTTYAVSIRIASQSVLASLARSAMIAEIILPTNSNLVFA